MSLGFACLATACASSEPHTFPQREYEFPVQVEAPDEVSQTGSLWSNAAAGNYFYTDQRAFRAGDLLTVRIAERANAQRNAGTSTSRSSDFSADMDSFAQVLERLEDLDSDIDPSVLLEMSSSMNFDGSGETNRSETLEATVQVIVRQVLPNGNIFVEGQRVITVNNEEQYLYVSGVARPIDINDRNELSSEHLADAVIEFNGSGVISQQQQPGWLTRFMGAVWPF